jgi:hypothetical protein
MAASSSSIGSAIRKGRRMTTVVGSANAAWGSATPHQVLPSCRSRVTRMNSGTIATAAGKRRPRTKTRNRGSRNLNRYRASG